MPEVWLELDTALRERLREVLADESDRVTEAELRKLAEAGGAYSRILEAELERLQSRLARLESDPDSSLGAVAGAFRRVHDFRSHLAELGQMLADLDDRARRVRTAWLLGKQD